MAYTKSKIDSSSKGTVEVHTKENGGSSPESSKIMDILQQLMTMQKDLQKQMSSIVTAQVAKEGKRVEDALGRNMEKSIKANVDALWDRTLEENAKREKAERDRMQQLKNLITNSVSKELPAIFERTLKKEITTLGQVVAHAIAPVVKKTISSVIAESVEKEEDVPPSDEVAKEKVGDATNKAEQEKKVDLEKLKKLKKDEEIATALTKHSKEKEVVAKAEEEVKAKSRTNLEAESVKEKEKEKRRAVLGLKAEERRVEVDKELQAMQVLSVKKNNVEVFIKLGADKEYKKKENAKGLLCTSCNKKSYCAGCLSKWYPEIPLDEIKKEGIAKGIRRITAVTTECPFKVMKLALSFYT